MIKPVFFSVFALSFIHNLFVVAHYITAIVVWQAYDCCLDDTVVCAFSFTLVLCVRTRYFPFLVNKFSRFTDELMVKVCSPRGITRKPWTIRARCCYQSLAEGASGIENFFTVSPIVWRGYGACSTWCVAPPAEYFHSAQVPEKFFEQRPRTAATSSGKSPIANTAQQSNSNSNRQQKHHLA